MRRAALLAVAAALALGGAAAADGPAVTARSSVDRSAMTLGDQVLLTVTVDLAKGCELLDPGVPRAVGDFEVVEALTALQSHLGDGSTRFELRYLVTAFELGPHRLPVIVVGYKGPGGATGEAATQGELVVNVASVVAPGEDASDIRPLKPPLPVPATATDEVLRALPVAVAIAAGAAAVVLLLRRRRRPRPVAVVAGSTARAALDELERVAELRLVEQGRAREHYELVESALRRFLVARYGVAAGARTARELRRELERAGTGVSAARVICAAIADAEAVRYSARPVSSAQARRSIDELMEVLRKAAVAEEYDLVTAGASA